MILPPLVGVSARHRGELSGRGRRRLDRDVLHPFLDFGQGQNAVDLGIEPTDDLARTVIDQNHRSSGLLCRSS